MMNNINKPNKQDEAMEKSIYNFTWSRLETLGSGELEEVKESQEKINNLIEDVINITGRKDIRRLLENIEEACTEQSTLLEEKAYRLGFKDGLKIVNSL